MSNFLISPYKRNMVSQPSKLWLLKKSEWEQNYPRDDLSKIATSLNLKKSTFSKKEEYNFIGWS